MSGHAHKNWGSDYAARAIFVRVLALVMMALSILMTLYAAYNFRLRGEMLLCAAPARSSACRPAGVDVGSCALRMKMDGPYDNRVLPVVLSGIMIVALAIVFGGAVVQFASGS